MLNPKVISESAETDEQYEGCLSFFNVRGLVPRPLHIEVACTRPDGQQYILALDDAMARLAAHEIDHLAGRLYVSRMRDGARPIPVSEYRGTGQTWAYPAPRDANSGTPSRNRKPLRNAGLSAANLGFEHRARRLRAGVAGTTRKTGGRPTTMSPVVQGRVHPCGPTRICGDPLILLLGFWPVSKVHRLNRLPDLLLLPSVGTGGGRGPSAGRRAGARGSGFGLSRRGTGGRAWL